MKRREFLATTAAAAIAPSAIIRRLGAEPTDGGDHAHHHNHAKCGLTYASPADAMSAPRETLAYCPAIYTGTSVKKPDYMATVDVDPASKTYSQVIHRTPMPNVGDELHHFGWNACSSCHGDDDHHRRFLVVPGLTSGRIHILDAADPAAPKVHKVIEPEQIAAKTNLATPHTVHCRADGIIMISMLGDANGDGPGGFLELDDKFEIAGAWAAESDPMRFNYDFWYQPRHNVMVSSEWGAPNTIKHGFKLEDVQAGKYGQHLNFWDWDARRIAKRFDLGEAGMIPLEVRFHHDPDSTHGFVGAALSSTVWHWHKPDGEWAVENVITVEPIEHDGWPFPVPGLITDVVLSMDDRWLYFSNWLHGDIRQYDVSNPSKPRLAGQAWLGGVLGKGEKLAGKTRTGGPQMLQLSLDGKRLYVTSSLYSVWDNQFYPDMADEGSYMLQLDCDTETGGLAVNDNFFVDFGKEPGGPARAHEIRFPNGDSTSDIWV